MFGYILILLVISIILYLIHESCDKHTIYLRQNEYDNLPENKQQLYKSIKCWSCGDIIPIYYYNPYRSEKIEDICSKCYYVSYD